MLQTCNLQFLTSLAFSLPWTFEYFELFYIVLIDCCIHFIVVVFDIVHISISICKKEFLLLVSIKS